MESREKPGIDGTQGVRSHGKDDLAGTPRSVKICVIALRSIALATTLVAAVVIGTARQKKTIAVQASPTVPPVPVTVEAKTAHASALVYFFIANAIACSYSAISLATLILKRASKGNLQPLLLSIVDVAMVALLFSGNGAAITFGLLGEHGNSHVRWKKVCNVFGTLCHRVAVSIIVSLLGSLAYVLLVLLAMAGLHRISP